MPDHSQIFGLNTLGGTESPRARKGPTHFHIFPSPGLSGNLRVFLALGYCRLWIPSYGEIARPLYQTIKDTQEAKLHLVLGTPEGKQAFNLLKQALLTAPALSLPTRWPYNLHITERKGVALGVLTQQKGPAQQPIGYLSKELDLVARGWPACLPPDVCSNRPPIPEALNLWYCGARPHSTHPTPHSGITKH